jgi:hypothetical protein
MLIVSYHAINIYAKLLFDMITSLTGMAWKNIGDFKDTSSGFVQGFGIRGL